MLTTATTPIPFINGICSVKTSNQLLALLDSNIIRATVAQDVKVLHFMLNIPPETVKYGKVVFTFGQIYGMLPAEVYIDGEPYLLEITKDMKTGKTIVQYGGQTGKLLCLGVHKNCAEAAAKIAIWLLREHHLSLSKQ